LIKSGVPANQGKRRARVAVRTAEALATVAEGARPIVQPRLVWYRAIGDKGIEVTVCVQVTQGDARAARIDSVRTPTGSPRHRDPCKSDFSLRKNGVDAFVAGAVLTNAAKRAVSTASTVCSTGS